MRPPNEDDCYCRGCRRSSYDYSLCRRPWRYSQPAPVGFEPANDWTGFYAGIFGGIGAADFDLVPVGIPAGFLSTGRGAPGGVQVGYDYQIGSLVLGAVADIALSGVEGRSTFGGLGGFEYVSRLDYLGTVRARAGFLPTDDLLVYAHGFAYARSTPASTLAAYRPQASWAPIAPAGLSALAWNTSLPTTSLSRRNMPTPIWATRPSLTPRLPALPMKASRCTPSKQA